MTVKVPVEAPLATEICAAPGTAVELSYDEVLTSEGAVNPERTYARLCEYEKMDDTRLRDAYRQWRDGLADLRFYLRKSDTRTPVAGEVPNPIDPPSGCTFHPRCPFANDRCRAEVPVARPARTGAKVACHAVEEGRMPELVREYAPPALPG